MRGRATISVDNNLTAGEAGVAIGTADDELARGVEVPDGVLADVFDLSPRGIRTHLDLNKPIYAKTSAYGHFGRKPGRDGSFSWEKTDLVQALKAAVKAA